MRNIVVNGVQITVGTVTEARELGIADRCYQLTPLPLVIANSHLTRGELFKLAGYDVAKIDFAVPESWCWQVDEGSQRCKRVRDPANWAWSYEDGHIGGRPVHIREAESKAAEAILAALTADDT